ncbi:MAG: HD domain-containing protein [Candidatus Cloacimonetes bacterium]|nr:HD domain-containing protein [Candidatus Cloacimonadota bacterium]
MDLRRFREIFRNKIDEDEQHYSQYACKDEAARRAVIHAHQSVRSEFARDRDSILYSGAYRRYQGKTQVFSFTNQIDEEMTNRGLHTTYVSQISRTIGKFLGLNLELIEAIALGHDLGHTPFGHDGEVALSECCQNHGLGHFHHNIQSLRIVDIISRNGRGLNLTFQVRDGIISHDGEVHNTILKPDWEKTEADFKDYIARKKLGENVKWMPATMEGCVVRISDTIAYIGQDIEDAIRLNILKRTELPKDCVEYLGDRNSSIIDTLVKSVIVNSLGKDYIAFDEDTSHYLLELKKFNYARIYTNENVKKAKEVIRKSMILLFDEYLQDIITQRKESKIFRHFFNHKNEEYCENYSAEEKVRDFLSTMTDRYFNEEVKSYFVPASNV